MLITQLANWLIGWYLIGLGGSIMFLPIFKWLNDEVTLRHLCKIPLFAFIGPVTVFACVIGYLIILYDWFEGRFLRNIDFDKKIW